MTFSERAVEAAAKAAAEINGDDFDKIPRHKSHWIEERGHFNGRWRDINEPFQSGYLEMAEACLTAALAVDGLALVPVWLIGQQRCPSDIRQSVSECVKCGCSLGLYVTRESLTAASDGEVG